MIEKDTAVRDVIFDHLTGKVDNPIVVDVTREDPTDRYPTGAVLVNTKLVWNDDDRVFGAAFAADVWDSLDVEFLTDLLVKMIDNELHDEDLNS